MRTHFATLLILGLFCGSTSAREISLREFLQTAKKHDLEFDKVLIEKLPTEYSKDLQLPVSQYLIEVRNEYGLAQNLPRTSTLGISAGKNFNSTGTDLVLAYENNAQVGRTEEVTTLTLEQSLYRNILGSRTRQLARSVEASNQSLKLVVTEAYEDRLAELSKQYLQWKEAYLKLVAARQLFADAKWIEKNAKARLSKSVALPIDLDRTMLQVLSREQSVLEQEAEFRGRSEAITKLAGIPEPLVPAQGSDWDLATLDLSGAWESFQKSSRGLQALRLEEDAAAEQLEYQKEALSPDLKALLGYRVDTSVRFNTPVNRNEWIVGFNLEIPLGNSQTDAAVKQAVYELKKAVLEKRTFEQSMRIQISDNTERIERLVKRVDLSKRKWELSQRIARAEERRYNQGSVDLLTLITAENDLAENYANYLTTQTELDKQIVEYLRLVDLLVVKDL